MTFCDIAVILIIIICVAALLCATIKRRKRKSKTGCGMCPFCNDENCPFNR